MPKSKLPHSNYILLDYDGFVCKSFYAALSSELSAKQILNNLTAEAIDKAVDYFESTDIGILPIMSGHTFKKDLYKDYKATRKKNPDLKLHRDEIIRTTPNIIVPSSLEADDMLVMINEVLSLYGVPNIVFSDDKDLKFYTQPLFCKINLVEEIERTGDWNNIYYQMLAGDKEDNITGIPKVGFATARKLLGDKPSFQDVIKVYRDKRIPSGECLKQLTLCIPTSLGFNTEASFMIDLVEIMLNNDYRIPNCLEVIQDGLIKYIQKEIDIIYKGD